MLWDVTVIKPCLWSAGLMKNIFVIRKPDFRICKNKNADQLRGNREADQRLCFHYIASTIPLLSKSKIFKHLATFDCTARFVSDPKDRFSHNEAHLIPYLNISLHIMQIDFRCFISFIYSHVHIIVSLCYLACLKVPLKLFQPILNSITKLKEK